MNKGTSILNHCLHQGAIAHPEHRAFVLGEQWLTYAQADEKSNQIVQALKQMGVAKGDRVGIYLFRRLETAPAVFAVLSMGAVFVPLDPFAPTERTRTCIEDCGIKVIITHNREYGKLEELTTGNRLKLTGVIGCEESNVNSVSWEAVDNMSTSPEPEVQIAPDDLAYILYTSGSTGKPKGIMHTHGSGMAFARLCVDLYNIRQGDIIGSFAHLHFDPSLFGYFAGPLAGATTLLIPEAHLKFPLNLSAYLEANRPTILFAVPKVYMQLVQYGKLKDYSFDNLRWVLYSGEPYPSKHLAKLMKLWPEPTFGNIYGPTELNQCTYYNLETPPPEDEPVPIGKVWDETQSLVIDEHDQPLPQGEKGELVVHSTTMMKGYWNRPELSERSFLSIDGVKYYRTGDLVFEDQAGELHFLGRKDRQVKVRGYRVELDEIEIVLVKHPAVKEVAVFPGTAADGSVEIESVISIEQDSQLEIRELKKHIKRYLPAYFIPEKINIVEDLPRNANGKIDYSAIRSDAAQTARQ